MAGSPRTTRRTISTDVPRDPRTHQDQLTALAQTMEHAVTVQNQYGGQTALYLDTEKGLAFYRKGTKWLPLGNLDEGQNKVLVRYLGGGGGGGGGIGNQWHNRLLGLQGGKTGDGTDANPGEMYHFNFLHHQQLWQGIDGLVHPGVTVGGIDNWYAKVLWCPLIYGGSTANADLTLQGTSHATKTTSYVLLQPSGGNVGIGTTTPTAPLHLQAQAVASTREVLLLAGVSDAANDGFAIFNGTTGNTRFGPTFAGHVESFELLSGLSFSGMTNTAMDGTGGIAVVTFQARRYLNGENWLQPSSGFKLVVYRPLFDWKKGDDSVAMRMTADGNLAIGTTDLDGTPPIGRLVVKGSTADGSTNIFVGRDSAEANVFYVDTKGHLGVGTTPNVSYGSNVLMAQALNATGYGTFSQITGNYAAGALTAQLIGVFGDSRQAVAQNVTTAAPGLQGIVGRVAIDADGVTVTYATGARGTIITTAGTARTYSTAAGFYASLSLASGGTIVDYRGLYVLPTKGSGALTTSYGVYIDTGDGATRYAFYNADAGAKSYSAYWLGLGVVPTVMLDVLGQGQVVYTDNQGFLSLAKPTGESANLRKSAIVTKHDSTSATALTADAFGSGYLWALKKSGGTTFDEVVAGIGAMWQGASDHGGVTRQNADLTFHVHSGTAQEAEIGRLKHDGLTLLGAGAKVLGAVTKYISFVVKTPVAADDFSIIQFPRAVTITAVRGLCIGGTNVIGSLVEYGTDATTAGAAVDSTDFTITTSEFNATSGFENADIAAGGWLRWITTSVSGSVLFLNITIEYTEQ